MAQRSIEGQSVPAEAEQSETHTKAVRLDVLYSYAVSEICVWVLLYLNMREKRNCAQTKVAHFILPSLGATAKYDAN